LNRMFAPVPQITFIKPPAPQAKVEASMKKAEADIKAAFLLIASHPLNAPFVKWCSDRGTVPTKRQARKYLKQFPSLRKAA
jgi:hypothetical protein